MSRDSQRTIDAFLRHSASRLGARSCSTSHTRLAAPHFFIISISSSTFFLRRHIAQPRSTPQPQRTRRFSLRPIAVKSIDSRVRIIHKLQGMAILDQQFDRNCVLIAGDEF